MFASMFLYRTSLQEIIMKRRVLYLCLMSVVLLFSVLTERPLLAKVQFPGEVLSALEIKKLVYGQAAEVEINRPLF